MKNIAIVTGGSRGIGAATAKLLAKSGVDVCLSYQSEAASAAAVVAACVAEGVSAHAVQADVSQCEDVARLFSACDEALGSPNILINNAGIVGEAGKLIDLKPEVLQHVFEVNLFGAIYCCKKRLSAWRNRAVAMVVPSSMFLRWRQSLAARTNISTMPPQKALSTA